MSLTVVTPAVSTRLTTVANLRLDLGLPDNSPSDALLERRIDQASADAVRVCRRVFGRQTYRQCLLASCGCLVLAAGPVNRIITIGFRGQAPLLPEQYVLDGDVLRLSSLRPTGCIGFTSILEVDFEAGWLLPGEQVGTTFTGDTPLPADIERAVSQLVGVAISESGRDPTIRSENVQGVGSTTYSVQAPGAMLPHPGAEAALQSYRMLTLA